MATDFGFSPRMTDDIYFISYKTEDSERVGSITRVMDYMGLPMWYDKGIDKGKGEWEKQISSKISKCKAVIIFITKNALMDEKTYMPVEFDLAKGKGKPIYVVQLDAVGYLDVTDALGLWYTRVNKRQVLNVVDETDPNKIAAKIIEYFDLKRDIKFSSSSDGSFAGIFMIIFLIIGLLGTMTYYGSISNSKYDDRINSYIYVHSDVDWQDAWDTSLERGDHLAWINSEEEYRYIVDYLNAYSEDMNVNINRVYIGGVKSGNNEYHWKNVDGQLFSDNLLDSSSWYASHWYTLEQLSEDDNMLEVGNYNGDVISLLHKEDGWYFCDSSENLIVDHPDSFRGRIGYLIEYEGGTKIQPCISSQESLMMDRVTIIDGIVAPAAEFIFPYSSSQLITEKELENLSDDKKKRMELSQIAINEIFARYGYYPTANTVSAQVIRDKYKDRDWYNNAKNRCPYNNQNELSEHVFNSVEVKNIEIINKWQDINS